MMQSLARIDPEGSQNFRVRGDNRIGPIHVQSVGES